MIKIKQDLKKVNGISKTEFQAHKCENCPIFDGSFETCQYCVFFRLRETLGHGFQITERDFSLILRNFGFEGGKV